MAFRVEPGSVHHKILVQLCDAPRAVAGVSEAMLVRAFGEPRAIDELLQARLIWKRGWHDGPGGVWLPTPEGEALCERLATEEPT